MSNFERVRCLYASSIRPRILIEIMLVQTEGVKGAISR